MRKILLLCSLLLWPVMPAVCAPADDDLTLQASDFPAWGAPVVKLINAGQYQAALKTLDGLQPRYGRDASLYHLRALAWAAIYETADDEAHEVQALQQARANMIRARNLAPAAKRGLYTPEIADMEAELKERGAPLAAVPVTATRKPTPAIPRPVDEPAAQPTDVVPPPAGTMPVAPISDGSPKPTVTGTDFPPLPPVRFPALRPRPGYIIGRAYHEKGWPLPKFFVEYSGFEDGKVAPMFNGMAMETVTGKIQGNNGFYAIKVPPGAYRAKAFVEIPYHGQKYVFDLWTKKVKYDYDGLGLVKLRQGIVKDFVWKLTDLKIDGLPSGTTETTFRWEYNGGVFYLYGYDSEYIGGKTTASVRSKYPKDAVVELILTPGDKLVDGSPSKTRVYRMRVDSFGLWTSYIRRVPVGLYTATARIYVPGGGVELLRLSPEGAKYNAATRDYRIAWRNSIPVLFKAQTGVLHGVEDFAIHLGPAE